MFSLFTAIYESKVETSETSVGDAFTTALQFVDQVQLLSNNNIKKAGIAFKAGEAQDCGKVVFDLDPRAHQVYYRSFADLSPAVNQVDLGYQLTQYHPRLAHLGKRTILGGLWRYNKSFTGTYLQHEF